MIKRILLCLILLTLFTSGLWADGKQPVKKEKFIASSLEELIELKENQEILYPEPLDGRQIDTLIYDDGSTTWGYYWTAGFKMAMRMSPSSPCQILGGIFYSWSQAGTPTFNAEIFDWTGSAPGSQLGTGVSVPTSTGAVWRYADFSSQSINVSGDFIMSFSMLDDQTVIGFDPINTGRAWDYTGSWSSYTETYFIRAVVEYGDGDPDIECIPNPLTVDMGTGGRDTTVSFYCKNVGTDPLDVTNIVRSAAWIDTIIPVAFSVPAAGSVQVMVTIDTTQVQRDETYHDTLLITSNDPDENPYGEVVILIVPGVEEEPVITITPATPSVKCHPNPTRNTTSIRFTLSHMADISIDVHDVSGRRVTTLANGKYESGVHNISWNRKDEKGVRVPQGIYFIRLKSEGIKANTKLIVID
jgi:hypothetical protein